MVHALSEIGRALTSEGTLIDLRPLADRWTVEVTSARESRRGGRVTDLPQGLEDDAAANQAMQKGAENGWFLREREEIFPFFYYWDSPNEMQEYVEEEWSDFIRIEDDVWRNVRSVWATGDADARVRVRLQMLLTRWKNNRSE
jgi:hypothetical protein